MVDLVGYDTAAIVTAERIVFQREGQRIPVGRSGGFREEHCLD
jgi:hypothetical protein